MGNSAGYVWEKMYGAIVAMCGRGSVKERLANATESALMRLTDDDLKGTDLYEDLQHVLSWTRNNMLSGEIQRVPDDLEHSKLVEKMLHILLETNDAD